MNTELIIYLKDFIEKNNIDGLIVNSTNEFLVEYNLLQLNSRYHLTGFTGSAGEVLFTKDKIYLFVDPRYHQQASSQVDNELIEVIKLPLDKTYFSALAELLPSYFKLGMVSYKTSKKFYDELSKNLQSKNSIIKLFNYDPVIEYVKNSIQPINYKVFSVDIQIAGKTPDEKFEEIKACADGKFNILVTSLDDIAYLTNLRSYDFEYSSVFPAKAVISDEEVKIYTDCALPYIGEKFKVFPMSEYENTVKQIDKTDLFIDESQLSIYDYKLINASNKIFSSQLKLIKTIKNENEINHLKKCFERADNALRVVYDMLESDTIYSEYDYYEALIKSMKDNGALSLSFKPIVAAGDNTSVVHYSNPSKEKLVQNGDMLLIDYGGYYEGGYATDTTRTFVKGDPSSEQKHAYTAVLKAFLNAYYNNYDKKAAYSNIDKIARETIKKSISDDYAFSHSTGHGVGINVHEIPPRVSSSDAAKSRIKENTVFSIEPGVYKEGWGGIRLENTVYASINEDKIVMNSFSHFPFEIKLVELSALNDYEKYYYMKWQAGACL